MKKEKAKSLLFTAVLMAIGLLIFKFLPMSIYGDAILFDASMHITIASFILYTIYLFIDKNKEWRVPYFIFCLGILTIISLQRIIDNAHNDIGLLMGFLLSVISIMIPNWKEIKDKIEF